MNTNKKIIIGSVMGCILGATVGYSASVVSLPHTFTAGTPIKASEVNANFSALAQEISKIKTATSFNTVTDFSEISLTPVNAAVNSTIVVGTENFTMKQKTDITDPITGKKYTLNYPSLSSNTLSDISYFVDGGTCKEGRLGRGLAVRAGNSGTFTSYVGVYGKYVGSSSGLAPFQFVNSFISVKVGNNLCAEFHLEQQNDFNNVTLSAIINRALELQKYVSVKET